MLSLDGCGVTHNGAILAGRPLSGLYAITDSVLMPGDLLGIKAESALRGGCRVLQYRNKAASAEQQYQEAKTLRELCHHYRCVFIVNDDVGLAERVGADGVHIGQTDLSISEARQRLGNNRIIGVSCHDSVTLAREAEQAGASYVAFGRFFASHTKPQAPAADLRVLNRAQACLRIPIVAIGGITRDNAPRVIAQGADMVAVIHDLFAAEDVEDRAKMFTRLFP